MLNKQIESKRQYTIRSLMYIKSKYRDMYILLKKNIPTYMLYILWHPQNIDIDYINNLKNKNNDIFTFLKDTRKPEEMVLNYYICKIWEYIVMVYLKKRNVNIKFSNENTNNKNSNRLNKNPDFVVNDNIKIDVQTALTYKDGYINIKPHKLYKFDFIIFATWHNGKILLIYIDLKKRHEVELVQNCYKKWYKLYLNKKNDKINIF